jgi:acyl-CoA thioesterase FadM
MIERMKFGKIVLLVVQMEVNFSIEVSCGLQLQVETIPM